MAAAQILITSDENIFIKNLQKQQIIIPLTLTNSSLPLPSM